MKTLLLTASILVSLFAQSQTEPDTTNIMLGDMNILVIDKSPADTTNIVEPEEDEDDSGSKATLTHWGGIDLGVNLLLNKNGGTTMDSAALQRLCWNYRWRRTYLQ